MMLLLYKIMFKVSVFLLLGDRLVFEFIYNKLFSIYPFKIIKEEYKRSITRSTIWIFSLIYQIPTLVVMILIFPLFIIEVAMNVENAEYMKSCEDIPIEAEHGVKESLGKYYNE